MSLLYYMTINSVLVGTGFLWGWLERGVRERKEK